MKKLWLALMSVGLLSIGTAMAQGIADENVKYVTGSCSKMNTAMSGTFAEKEQVTFELAVSYMILNQMDADLTNAQIADKLREVLRSDPVFVKVFKEIVNKCQQSPGKPVVQVIEEVMKVKIQ
jgi:hypothetical protein